MRVTQILYHSLNVDKTFIFRQATVAFIYLLATFVVAATAMAKPETHIKLAGVPAQALSAPLKIDDDEMMDELKRMNGLHSYEISFGRLTTNQFEQLKAYFKVLRPIAYNSSYSYSLIDFLPAKMQALLHRRLVTTERSPEYLTEVELFYRNSGVIYSTINCWGTALEMVRDSSTATPLYAFMTGRRSLLPYLQSEQYSAQVNAVDAQFGDLLLLKSKIGAQSTLQHAAVSIGYGYYFERTDSGSASFFRIAHLDEMRDRIKDSFDGSFDDAGRPVQAKVEFELRRFGLPGKQRIAGPITDFSVANSTNKIYSEYANAIPSSENRAAITLHADERMGGGDEITIYDITAFQVRLNPRTGRGEIATDVHRFPLSE